MLRRKSLIAAMLLITMSLEGPSPYTVYAGQTNEPGYVETVSEPNQAFPLSGYMRNVYTVTQYPELDEAVFQAFAIFEANKESSSYVSVYKGTYEACYKFYNYFTSHYGYTKDMRPTLYKMSDGTYMVAFTNTLNADTKISAYIAEVMKAQTIAASLKAETNDATANNIINWVKANAKYYYSNGQNYEDDISHYYGIYSGSEVLCQGYAMAVYQLCAMNGIASTITEVVSPRNVNHAVNQVTYSDLVRWVDTTKIDSVSDSFWSGYTLR